MANHKDKRTGECLARIAFQAKELCEYILKPEKNGGKISLGEVKAMSNVIVSNVRFLEDLDKKSEAKA